MKEEAMAKIEPDSFEFEEQEHALGKFEAPFERQSRFDEQLEWDGGSSVHETSDKSYVRWIQESLNEVQGLTLNTNGIMDAQTRSAIRHFQTKNGLVDRGEIGEETANALQAELIKRPPRIALPSRRIVQAGNASRRLVLSAPEYTQCDFIDSRIDVAAQYALFGMLRGERSLREASLQMLAAVRGERLAGIYQEDQRVPALRAVALGLKWWGPLVDRFRRAPEQSAVCVPPIPTSASSRSADRLPIIAFRRSLASDIAGLGRQLRTAWLNCGLPALPLPAPSGKPCPRRAPIQRPPAGKHDGADLSRRLRQCDERWQKEKAAIDDLYNTRLANCNGDKACEQRELNLWAQDNRLAEDRRRLCIEAAKSLQYVDLGDVPATGGV